MFCFPWNRTIRNHRGKYAVHQLWKMWGHDQTAPWKSPRQDETAQYMKRFFKHIFRKNTFIYHSPMNSVAGPDIASCHCILSNPAQKSQPWTSPLTDSRPWNLGSLRRFSSRRILSLADSVKKWTVIATIISESRDRSWADLREDNQNNKSMALQKVHCIRVGGSRPNWMIIHEIEGDRRGDWRSTIRRSTDRISAST
jgi:hypothetical protein